MSCMGKAGKVLKRNGWVKIDHAQVNNRNGFDYVLPGRKEEYLEDFIWRDELSKHGMRGIAVWITDAQWGRSEGITNRQWERRRVI